MIYYVLDNACPTLEDAVEVQYLYQCAGIAVDIITETEYFEELERTSNAMDTKSRWSPSAFN